MEERRKSRRQRTCLGGRIAVDKRYSTMECLVRDLTADGARLGFSQPTLLPQEFDLSIEHRGLRSRARIIWRMATAIGVAFNGVPAQPLVPLALSLRLTELQAENTALRRRLGELSS